MRINIFLRCAEKAVFTAAETEYPVGTFKRLYNVMRNHDNGHAVLFVEVVDELIHFRCSCRIKSGNRLVQKKKLLCGAHCSCKKHSLLLTAGKLTAAAVGKVGNSKSVKVTSPKGRKATLKVGGKVRVKAKAVAQSSKLKVKKHRAITFETSNPKVATVSAKGVVRAVGKGKCYVYAYSQNGKCAKVTVTVR